MHAFTPGLKVSTSSADRYSVKLGRARFLIAAVCFCMAFVAIAGCGSDKQAGNVDVALYGGDPGILAFEIASDDAANIMVNLFDGLTDFDSKTGEIYPKVAGSWSHSKDFKTWTFKLKDDYKFCNGEPVTSKSFKAGWQAATDKGSGYGISYLFANIVGTDSGGYSTDLKGLSTPSSDTLVVKLKESANYFDAQVAHPSFSPVPVKYFSKHKEDFARKPVGNGPFCLTSYKPDRYIRTKANAHYEGSDRDKPKLKTLTFKVYEDIDASWDAYVSGQVDESEVPDVKRKNARTMAATEFITTPILAVNALGFNVERPPFKGEKGRLLRQAINYAIDREAIVEGVLAGDATVATGYTSPGTAGYESNLSPYTYDPDKAGELLKEAGYPSGKGLPRFTLAFNTGSDQERIVALIRKNLAEVGIEVDLKGYDPEVFFGRNLPAEGDVSFFRWSWIADYPSYEAFLQPNFDSSTIPDGDVYRYRNEKFDDLLSRARTASDKVTSYKLYQDAERLMFEDPPVVPLYFYKTSRAIKSTLKGYARSIDDTVRYELVSKD